MISRRALLGTGAATAVVAAGLVGADLAHRLDDLARGVGIRPHPEPDPADVKLLAYVATSQSILLQTVLTVADKQPGLDLAPFIAISREHLKAVGGAREARGGPVASDDRSTAVRNLSRAYAKAAQRRSRDAIKATSPELTRVLASMSAGLSQCAESVGDLR